MRLIALLLLLAQTVLGLTQLTGTLRSPLGGLGTGTLYLSPPLNVTLANACAGVGGSLAGPTATIIITVTSGVLQSPPRVVGNDCLIPAGNSYSITFRDSAGNTFYGMWQIVGTTFDISSQLVSLLGVVQQLPGGIQTISQSGATKLYINRFAVTDVQVSPGGTGAPTGTCEDKQSYIQTDAAVGSKLWVCASGWEQQGTTVAPGSSIAIQKNSSTIGIRSAINVIESSSVLLTVADNSVSSRVDITPVVAPGGVTNTMLAGSIDLSTKVIGTLPTASIPQFAGGDVISAGGSLVLTIGAGKVTNTMLAGNIDLSTKVINTLPVASLPAYTGDVSSSAGNAVLTIGAAKVLNSMLAGSIDLSTKVINTLPATSLPALSGDVSNSAAVVTVLKVDGVSYPASPSLHSTPVVTASNTVSYKALPDCQDAGGNHLNWNQSVDGWVCGTSQGPVPLVVQKNGTTVGTRGTVNVIESSQVLWTIADNSGQNRIDITPTIAATSITNSMLAGSIDLSTKVINALPIGSLPAFSGGDVTSSAASAVLTIGAGKVTNTMLAGSIDLSTKVINLLPANSMPILGGDVGNSGATITVNKVNAVVYPASPSLHSVPVVTASNTATYKVVPTCTDVGGNHLNYDQSTDAWQCGTSTSGGAGSVTVQKNGSTVGSRPTINLIESAIVLTVTDNSGQGRIDITPTIGAGAVTNTMLAGSIDLTTKVINALPAANFPALTGDATNTAGSLVTTVGKINGVAYPATPAADSIPVVTSSNTVTYKSVPDCQDASGNHLNYTTSTHTWNCGNTTPGGTASVGVLKNGTLIGTRANINLIEGSGVTLTVADNSGAARVDVTPSIGASAITNTMLAGSIDLATKVIGILPSASHPALTGDVSNSSGSVTITVAKVNGVSYPAAPSTSTIPVITASNTATYKSLPDCPDSGGNHLNFVVSTATFSCGTSGGGSGGGVHVYSGGTSAGTEIGINFTAGPGVTVSATDNPGASRVDVSYAIQSGFGIVNCTPTGGSTTAYTCAPSPTISSYTTGLIVSFSPDVSNGLFAKVDINSNGQKSLVKKNVGGGTSLLDVAEAAAGNTYLLVYNGTDFVVQDVLHNFMYQFVQDEGTNLTQRIAIDFIGAGVTCVDSVGNARTECTIPGGGGSGPTTDITRVNLPSDLPGTYAAGGIRQVDNATVSAGGLPYYITRVANVWEQLGYVAGGTGALTSSCTTLPCQIDIVTSVVPIKSGVNAYTGVQDNSGTSKSIPPTVGTNAARPSSGCSPGQQYHQTDGTAGLYINMGSGTTCTWQSAGAGGSVTVSNGSANRIPTFDSATNLNGLIGNQFTWNGNNFVLGGSIQALFGGNGNTVDCATTTTFADTLASSIRIRLTGNCTASSSGFIHGGVVTIQICQDATGGRTFTWPASYQNPPTVTSTASSCTVGQFQGDGTLSKWWGPPTGSGGAVSSVFGQIGAVPNLSGDVSTSGSSVVAVAKVNAVSYPASPSTDTVPVITASNTATYTSIPNCLDSGGNHLNYATSTHVFSCGTSGGGSSSIGVQKNGTLIGTRSTINLIEGSGVTLTVTDNSGSSRVDVTPSIGTGAITNTMLAGSIDLATKVTGILPAGDFPALGGDLSGSNGSLSVTVAKVDGVSYPASPATDTVPVVTSSNTVTYKAVPDCSNTTTSKLLYATSTHAFSCGTDQTSGGSSTTLTLSQSTKSTTYTITGTDFSIWCNATSGGFTTSLPASPTDGQVFTWGKVDASANTCTLSGNGHTIDGNSTIAVTEQFNKLMVQYDAANTTWRVI